MPDQSLSFAFTDFPRARRWLFLGTVALGLGGLFAGTLGKVKGVVFDTMLVMHVDLSVLVWFSCMACLLFALASGKGRWMLLDDASFVCALGGMLCILLSPLTGGAPLKSDYIPVLYHPLFFLGITLLGCALCLNLTRMILIYFFFMHRYLTSGVTTLGRGTACFGVLIAGLMLACALIGFGISYATMPPELPEQLYYENLFWGGGHLLQLVWAELTLVCWWWLAQASGLRIRPSDYALRLIYVTGLLASCCGLAIYAAESDPSGDVQRGLFTVLMRHGNGIGAMIALLYLIPSFFQSRDILPEEAGRQKLALVMLSCSIFFFLIGGLVGYRIQGSDLIVPTHYHGSIVGMTLAFMGIAYLLLPRFGYGDPALYRLSFWQPFIYGGGQLCWMVGMGWLGLYGAPRKTPGSAEFLSFLPSLFKHTGDGIALIGGLLFPVIVLMAVFDQNTLRDKTI
jgi:hypothetical protein